MTDSLGDREDARAEKDAISSEIAHGAPPNAQATDEQKVAYVLTRYAMQNEHYRGLNQQWTKPIYFIVGKQWWKYNTERSAFEVDTDVPEWRQQPVTNWTFAVYRTLLAKLTKQRPVTEVVPPSGDSEDREAAELGEAILTHLWRLLKCPQKMRRALGWLIATGNVALRVDWDPEAGELRPRTSLVEMPHPMGLMNEDGTPQTNDVACACDEQGEPLRRTSDPENPNDVALDGGDPYDLDAEPTLEPIGEIAFSVVDPLSYRWNAEATSEDDATEYFEARMVARQAIAEEYEVDAATLKTGSQDGEDREAIDEMLASVTAGSPDPFDAKGTTTAGSRKTGDQVLVIKYYRKPCSDYPEGRHFIVAGGSKVWPKEGESPLPEGFWPPVVPMIDCPIPGQPQGLGVLSQVVPLNEKYNQVDGKIGEYHTMMALGGVIWAHPDDRGIEITTEPGQVKVSKGMAHGHPPIREQLTALPGPVYAEREVIAGNIQAIAATSSLDLGQKPEGVSAGRAFLVIQEATTEVIGPTLEAIENAIGEIGRRKLVLAQRHYSDERTIQIRGERGKWEFRSFTNADLRDGLDVRVQTGSSFPWSKSAQLDTKLSVLEAFPQRLLKPDGTFDEQKFAKLLDTSQFGLSTFQSDEDDDLVECEREHAMFEAYDPTNPEASNELPQIAFWQDQMKHQAAHYAFMKRSRARFDRWSQGAQIEFTKHMQLTLEANAKMVQTVLAAQSGAAPGSAPGGPPGAAPPGVPGTPGDEPPTPTGGAPRGGPPRPPSTGGAPLQLTAGDRAAANQ